MGARIGLALIAKDSADTLPVLLDSIAGAFDRVVLLDTGSTDTTLNVFRQWATGEHGPPSWATASVEWTDDFAAARNTADQLLVYGGDTPGEPLVDWTCWADTDDELRGAHNLRRLANSAPPEVAAYVADYEYAHTPQGQCICLLKRERLVRASHAANWAGPVHEAQLIAGQHAPLPPEVCTWVHRKPTVGDSNERNLRILHAWNERQPDQPRVLVYLGTEYLTRRDYDKAIPYLRAYLDLHTGFEEERAQVHRKLAVCLLETGQPDQAEQVALDALRLLPDWPDSYLTLAHVAYHQARWPQAAAWARRVLALGMPQTLLIVNPLDYTYQPRLILAGALGELGDYEEAVRVGQEALQLEPSHEGLRAGMRVWREQIKRHHTIQSALAMADLMVQHDEQAKALRFLEQCVPYYVHDAPPVVQARHRLRARVRGLLTYTGQAEHYRKATERGIPDEDMAIVEHLSRARFLRDGLTEQMGAA